jgi:uncharacterized ion transporter superfamily protein YfcC
MAKLKKVPSPITILMVVIIIAAVATWLVPAGRYNTLSVNEEKSFSVLSAKGETTTLHFTQKNIRQFANKNCFKKFCIRCYT